jgi:hypothetical protein
MTVVNPKSISGINSITMASGSDNLLTIHTTNTTERVRVNSDGDVIVGSGITVSPDGDIFATGVTTSTTFSGNFSGGTVSGTTGTFTGDLSVAQNIVHTGDTDTKIELITDTIKLHTAGTERFRTNSTGQTIVGDSVEQLSTSSERPLQVHSVNGPKIAIGRNDTSIVSGNTIGGLEFYGNDANGTFVNTASIIVNADGDHGDNDKPTRMQFYTTVDGGSSAAERLRITNDGQLVIGGSSSNTFAGLQRLDIFNTSTADNYHGSLIRLITKNAAGNATASYDMVKYKEGTVSHNNNESSGSINFYAGGATRLQVLSTGNINVNDGDVVLASGHGIDFSATGQGSNTSSESELFNDYEQGSCAILIHDAAGSNISVTGGNHKYTKIGNRVFVEGQFTFAESGSKNGGLMQLYQLPYTPAQVSPAGGNFWYDGPSDATDVTGLVYVHTNGTCYLKQSTTQGQNSNYKYLTFNEIAANSNRILFISFNYITS